MNHLLRSILPLLLAAAAPATPAFLTVLPVSQTVTVGQTLEVSILIDGVVDLAAWQVDLGFDPTILSATIVNYDFFLGPDQETLAPTIDNGFGTISGLGAFLPAGPGVSGSGQLVSIQFTALAPGQSGMAPFNLILLDSTFADIAYEDLGQPASVTVQPVSGQVPEPETLWLSALGLVFLVSRHRAFERRR